MTLAHQLDKEPLFTHIQQVADQLQLPTYVIGGYVRDLFLHKTSPDIDIVCVGNGLALAKAVAHHLGVSHTLVTFKRFGTAMIRWQKKQIEFVGARRESYSQHTRKPAITSGTLTDDQQRRDFTINAMAISLNKATFGALIDSFKGYHDLQKKLIRTPTLPGKTFSDDPLRMLRAIRFATQLKFHITPITLTSITQQAPRLPIISKERISQELNKIIASPQPSQGFKLLLQTGLLQLILPDLLLLKGVERINGHAHKDNFYHTLEVLDNVAEVSNNLWLRWAALLHDIAKPQTKAFRPGIGWTFHGHEVLGARKVPQIFRALRLPLNEKMRYVKKLVRLHLRPIALVDEKVTDAAIRRLIFDAGELLEDLMILCRADITSKNPKRVQRYLRHFDAVEAKIKKLEAKDKIRNFQPIITGAIIMQTFGLSPSRPVGTIKALLKQAILEGKIKNTYQEAYPYMLKIAAAQGYHPLKKS